MKSREEIIKYFDERIDTVNKNIEELEFLIDNISAGTLKFTCGEKTYYPDMGWVKSSLENALSIDYRSYNSFLENVKHRKKVFIELSELFDVDESKQPSPQQARAAESN